MVGLLMSLLADLWPLRWRLAARWRWRHVSPPLAFGGEDCSGGVSLRIGTAASMVGGGGAASLCPTKETSGGW
jgi:hypothetical protein